MPRPTMTRANTLEQLFVQCHADTSPQNEEIKTIPRPEDQCSKMPISVILAIFGKFQDIEQKSTNSTFQQNVPHFLYAPYL